jgi:nucleoside-diphosphate-sugar epimerase
MIARILVTGATGSVGAELVAVLARAGHAVTAVMHSNAAIVRPNGRRVPVSPLQSQPQPGRVSSIAGDICQEHLGLGARDLDRLYACTDVIVHSAAATQFGLPDAVYEQVNVGGTRNVLGLAAGAPVGALPMVHVSTAYVCGNHDGSFHETDAASSGPFANGYERTKAEAERLVGAARRAGLRAATVRPSIVVGTESSGAVRDFRNIYTLLKVISEGRLTLIPGEYDATLDLVPVSYVAELIANVAVRIDEVDGKTFHAVSGEPLTLRAIGEVAAEYPSFQVPRFVPTSSFDIRDLDAFERRYYQRVVQPYESYIARKTAFSNSQAVRFLGRAPAVRGKALVRRLLDFCIRSRFLGDPLPGPAEFVTPRPAVGESARSQPVAI